MSKHSPPEIGSVWTYKRGHQGISYKVTQVTDKTVYYTRHHQDNPTKPLHSECEFASWFTYLELADSEYIL